MSIRRWIILIPVALLLIGSGPAQTDGIFYEGNVVIDSIITSIRVDQEAEFTAEFTLVNRGQDQEEVDLAYIDPDVRLLLGEEPLKNPVPFTPGEVKRITISSTAAVEGLLLRSFSLAPTLYFNGKRNQARVNEFTTQIVLPPGVTSLMSSNQEYDRVEVNAEGRTVYIWERFDIYPTTLSATWSESGIELGIEKAVSPESITEVGQELEITIVIQNEGNQAVESLVLQDDYVPSDFEAIEPSDELFITSFKDSDPRLLWRVQIDRLDPGESRTFQYAIRYVSDEINIRHLNMKPCAAYMDGVMAGISNAVSLNKAVGEHPPELIPVTRLSVWPIVIGLGAGVGVVAVVVVVIVMLRRRRQAAR